MLGFVTTRVTKLRKAAADAAESLGDIAVGTRFLGTHDKDGFVKTQIISVSQETGFVDFGHAREIATEPEPLGEGEDIFCAMVTKAARAYGIERDYLMAVAYSVSNNLTDFGTEKSERIGPFQFTKSEWEEAITNGAAKSMGYSEEDRLFWYRQPTVAALLAMGTAKQLMAEEALGRAPDHSELFFAQRFGGGAEKVLKSANRSVKIASLIEGSPSAGSYAAELKAGDKTVHAVLDEVKSNLIAGLVEALKVIDRQPPEIRFFRTSDMDPPWMRVARDEAQRDVVDISGKPGASRIILYHAEAGLPAAAPGTPWCGAFVTYCMKQSDVATIKNSVPPSPALARSWLNWGKPVAKESTPSIGSVVVLENGGHVGFLAERPADATESADQFVWILGGNQGTPRQIGVVRFPKTSVVEYRWLDFPLPVEKIGKVDAAAMRDKGVAVKERDKEFIDLAPRIIRDLQAKLPPLTDIQAAAILGNIGHECDGFHGIREYGANGVSGGYGWCQWTNVRRKTFRAHVEAMGKPWNADTWADYDANLSYLVHELTNTSEKKALTAIRQTNDLDRAVVLFEENFERAEVKHYDRRQRYARLALASL